jgi:hypothetical protein
VVEYIASSSTPFRNLGCPIAYQRDIVASHPFLRIGVSRPPVTGSFVINGSTRQLIRSYEVAMHVKVK